MDELMKLFANKSAPTDPNDMPLSTLIENNNESMDVNFVGRNNFGNNHWCASVLNKRFLTPFRDGIWNRRQVSVGDRGVLPTRPRNRRG